MNDAENRRFFRTRHEKSFFENVWIGVLIFNSKLISGKFSEIAEINSANSEVIIRPRNQGSFGTFGTGRLQTLSRVLIGCDFNHVRRFGTGMVGLRGVAHASARDTHPGHCSDPATHHDFTHVSDRRSRSAGSSRTPLARIRRRPLRVDHPRPTRFREMVGRYPEGQWGDRG